ncbi:MAG: DUF3253 domain-containing protein [Pseudomonadota bacterium]
MTDPHTVKICPIVLRDDGDGPTLLAYFHPHLGNQLLRAALTTDQQARALVLSLVQEQAGLKPSGAPVDWGQSKGIIRGEAWHFFALPVAGAANSWDGEAEDGEPITFFFQKLDEYLDEEDWPPAYIKAIAHVRNRVSRLDQSSRDRLMPPADTVLAETILTMATERGLEKSLCPSEVARAMAGSDEKEWRKLMKPIRAEAVRLASNGQITITRKGKPVDPGDFKGIYRITLPKP